MAMESDTDMGMVMENIKENEYNILSFFYLLKVNQFLSFLPHIICTVKLQGRAIGGLFR